jgi:hypothetical protein
MFRVAPQHGEIIDEMTIMRNPARMNQFDCFLVVK